MRTSQLSGGFSYRSKHSLSEIMRGRKKVKMSSSDMSVLHLECTISNLQPQVQCQEKNTVSVGHMPSWRLKLKKEKTHWDSVQTFEMPLHRPSYMGEEYYVVKSFCIMNPPQASSPWHPPFHSHTRRVTMETRSLLFQPPYKVLQPYSRPNPPLLQRSKDAALSKPAADKFIFSLSLGGGISSSLYNDIQ